MLVLTAVLAGVIAAAVIPAVLLTGGGAESGPSVPTISTVAGNGEAGFSGDGRPATEAQLKGPWDLAIDEEGNLYIGDSARVRRVDPEGVITTVAGTGARGAAGDGAVATDTPVARPNLTIDADGSVLVANANSDPILRRLRQDGSFHVIAGTGFSGRRSMTGIRLLRSSSAWPRQARPSMRGERSISAVQALYTGSALTD